MRNDPEHVVRDRVPHAEGREDLAAHELEERYARHALYDRADQAIAKARVAVLRAGSEQQRIGGEDLE